MDKRETTTGRRTFLRHAGQVGAGVVVGSIWAPHVWAAGTATPTPKPPWTDIDLMKTAAKLENLAVVTYGQLLALPQDKVGTANPFVAEVLNLSLGHHQEHAVAFNRMLVELGSGPVSDVDQVLQRELVTPGLSAISNPGGAVGLAATLENTIAQTYVRFTSKTYSLKTASLLAGIAPVEAQHLSVMLTVQSLLSSGDEGLLEQPAGRTLPSNNLTAGLPTAIMSTRGARSEKEGAKG